MHIFQYHPDILQRFPQVVGGAVLAWNVANDAVPDDFAAFYQNEQQRIARELGVTPLSQLEPLVAWRRAFRAFGVDPTRYRSAAEALLRRLTRKDSIPSINLLVDIGNLVSIRYALPVAVFERQALQMPVTVRFANGSERYHELGAGETADHPEPGEVVFSDASGQVVARRWCWRQSEAGAARVQTRECLITIEAHHSTGHQDIEAALRDLRTLLAEYAGGTSISAVLDVTCPLLVS
jgi:DNA/RNA-binding domain of Phe-tRNA-synthetase-like protein